MKYRSWGLFRESVFGCKIGAGKDVLQSSFCGVLA